MDQGRDMDRTQPAAAPACLAPPRRPGRAGAALRWGRAYLAARGLDADEARASARVLLAHVLGVPGHAVVAEPERPLPAGAWRRYLRLIRRRGRREPVAYLVGAVEFYGRSFRVTPATLIPRPETELLVDLALSQLPEGPCTVADLGTGSGAIAVTLALERPRWTVLATDCSEAALAVARGNARLHGVEERMRWYAGDWCEPLLAAGWGGKLAAVISNPPYIAAPELPGLADEVRRYEPRIALTPGVTGLEAYERLVPGACRLLVPGGRVLLEVGHGQAGAVMDLLRRHGFHDCRAWTDLAGIPRVVGGRWEP